MTLDCLKPGQSGVISVVGGQGALRRRLLDMGLTPKTKVSARKVAPMGDPIELYLRRNRSRGTALLALAGNQNCGKTTLFNALTGSNQHVGNFPGVTVEKKEGSIKKYKDAVLVDLPGIYSLSPYTSEEVVTRDFLVKDRPDAIINIVDATNLERNLYPHQKAVAGAGHPGHSNLCCQRRGHLGPAGHRNQNSQG